MAGNKCEQLRDALEAAALKWIMGGGQEDLHEVALQLLAHHEGEAAQAVADLAASRPTRVERAADPLGRLPSVA